MQSGPRAHSSLAIGGAVALSLVACGCLNGPRHNYHPKTSVVVASSPMARGAAYPASTPMRPGLGTTSELALDETPIESTPEVPPSLPRPAPKSTTPPAQLYGALDGDACEAMLKSRGVPFIKVDTARGVDRPIRFTGLVHGIDIHGGAAKADRAKSPYEILDCRLALAIDDFAALLAGHDIVEIVHFSTYRAPPKGSDLAKPKSEHEAGLAMDLGAMIKKDGTRFGVLEDWHGGIGQPTCGKDAFPTPSTKNARELRAIVCASAEAQLFNLILTPNFNAPHKNHFHLEVKRNVKWFMVH